MGELGRTRFLTLVLVCGFLHVTYIRAQAAVQAPRSEKPVSTDGPSTLHLYANLVQMPVLVLSSDRQRVPVIKPERFSFNIDNGPWYQPKYVRQEGTDPISLTIVLDFGGTASELMPKLGEAFARATPQGLTPRDRVSMMAMQCGLVDILKDVPAEPGLLQPKISEAVKAWAGRDGKKSCEEDSHLWDTLLTAALRLDGLPGRHVIIAVTDGKDRGSKHFPDEVASEMQTFAVTTFAVTNSAPESDVMLTSGPLKGDVRIASSAQDTSTGIPTAPLDRLCELSGGIALIADRSNASKQFAHIPELIRGRYILEFPRPFNTTAGGHKFNVKVAKSDDFIRSSGTSVPLADPKTVGGTTTVSNNPTQAPQIEKTNPHLLP